MGHARWAVLLLAAAAGPLPAQVASPVVDGWPVPAEAPPPPDLSRLDETALRALAGERGGPAGERERAAAELADRFPFERTRAFLMNAEATALADAFKGEQAYALFTRVRALHAGDPDPALEREVARAIQGQALALDVIEATEEVASGAPLERLTAETIDLDSTAYRLRRELVDLFRGHRDPAIRRIVGWERYNLMVADQIAKDRLDAARFVALAADYEDHPGLQDLIAEIYFHLGWSDDDPARRVGWFQELPRRFSASQDEHMRSRVNDAYSWIVGLLEDLGRAEEAALAGAEYESWSGYPLPPRANR